MEESRAPCPPVPVARSGSARTGLLLATVIVAAVMSAMPDPLAGRAERATPQLQLASEHLAGSLDTTFDGDGIAVDGITSFVRAVDTDVLRFDDGSARLLVLTSTRAVWRFLPDGRLDPAFHDDGVLPLDALNQSPVASDLRLATSPTEPTFVVGGFSDDVTPTRVRVSRFLANGQPDTTFGADGTTTAVGGQVTAVTDECGDTGLVWNGFADIGVQSDGDVVAVGPGNVFVEAGEFDFCEEGVIAARIPSDGDAPVLSGTADGNSQALTPSRIDLPRGGDFQDHVLVSATHPSFDVDTGAAPRVTTVRFTDDVEPDTTFGEFGIAEEADHPHSLAADPLPIVAQDDGTAAVAARDATASQWDLLRWDGEGLPVGSTTSATFDDTVDPLLGSDALEDMAVTSDGFVMTGWVTFDEPSPPAEEPADPDAVATARFAADGTFVDIDLLRHGGVPPTDVRASAIATLPDGQHRVVGWTNPDYDDLNSRELMITALDDAGAHVPTFGTDGPGFAVHLGARRDAGEAVAIRSDLSIVAAGTIDETGQEHPAGFALRRQPTGPPDTSFAPDPDPAAGIEITEYDAGDGDVPMTVNGMALDARERPIVVGAAAGSGFGGSGMIARLTPDGDLDPSFNTFDDGGTSTPTAQALSLGGDTVFRDVAVDPSGGIVVVGTVTRDVEQTIGDSTFTGVVREVVVIRLAPDGTRDLSFGDADDGVVRITPATYPHDVDCATPPCATSGTWDADGNGIVIDDAGRIVVTGQSQGTFDDGTDRLLVARLLADGTRDPGFGTHQQLGDGVRLGPAGHVGNDVVTPGDRILVTGTRENDRFEPGFLLDRAAYVAQFTEDGESDPTFGTDGIALPFDASESGNSTGRAIALDAVGNLIIVGGSLDQSTTPEGAPRVDRIDVLVARLLTTGDLDTTFGTGGLVTTDVGAATDADLVAGAQARDVAIAPDGRIVVTGSVLDDRGERPLTARYNPGVTTMACDPDPLDAGGVEVGSSTTTFVTCTSTGGTVVLTDVALDPGSTHPDDYSIDPGTCAAATLFPDQTCTFSITFTPRADGDRSVEVSLSHTAATGPTITTIPVQGRGTGEPGFSADPNPVSLTGLFGTSTPPETITVTNLGNLPMTISDVTVVGPNTEDFDVTDSTCTGTTVAAGSTCTVDVAFLPLPGPELSRNARLRFDDDAAGAPHFVGLRGSVGGPSIELDPSEGPIETQVEASGIGFEPGTAVQLRIGDAVLDTVPGDEVTGDTFRGGTFTTTFTLPEGTPGGQKTVEACQSCDSPDVVAASAPFDVTPRLFVLPFSSRPGGVVTADGDGFPAGAPITLTWSRGLGTTTVLADASGEFSTPVLVFRKDQLGLRDLQATISGAEDVAATTPFLAVPGSAQPSDFAVRR